MAIECAFIRDAEWKRWTVGASKSKKMYLLGRISIVYPGGGTLKIGSKTTISGNVLITNTDHGYEAIGQSVMAQPLQQRNTNIGENCFIGYGAMIQAGTKLGKQCIVGANAVVRGEFPDYCVIVGVPAHVVKRYNAETGQWENV